MAQEDRMLQAGFLEAAILQELARVGTCTFQELREKLHSFSWNKVFAEVDRLTRDGTRRHQTSRSGPLPLSLAPHLSAEARHVTPG